MALRPEILETTLVGLANGVAKVVVPLAVVVIFAVANGGGGDAPPTASAMEIRSDLPEELLPSRAIAERGEAWRHVHAANRDLRKVARHLEAGLRPPAGALTNAVFELAQLEGPYAERARPVLLELDAVQTMGSTADAADRLAQLVVTMERDILLPLDEPLPEAERIADEAMALSDAQRCRLAARHLQTYLTTEHHDYPRAHAHRRTGAAIMGTVQGRNRALAHFVLDGLEDASAASEWQAVGYAARRCEE